jgi:hypothetical protein
LTGINARGGADLDDVSVAVSRPFESNSMIKDIIVYLEHPIARDPACEFAITIAESFEIAAEVRGRIAAPGSAASRAAPVS